MLQEALFDFTMIELNETANGLSVTKSKINLIDT